VCELSQLDGAGSQRRGTDHVSVSGAHCVAPDVAQIPRYEPLLLRQTGPLVSLSRSFCLAPPSLQCRSELVPGCRKHGYRVVDVAVLHILQYLLQYFLVHGQVTIIFVVSAGLSLCLFVCAEFFSAVFDPISIKLGHMLYVWV